MITHLKTVQISFNLGRVRRNPCRSAIAENTSLEERLQRLESEVGTLRKENQQLRSDLGL